MAASPSTDDRTRAQRVQDDYEYYLGRELLVKQVDAFCDAESRSEVLKLEPPVRVRVVTTDDDSLFRYIEDWLDPIWDVQVLDRRPELAGYDSFWVYGISYNKNGETEQPIRDWTDNF